MVFNHRLPLGPKFLWSSSIFCFKQLNYTLLRFQDSLTSPTLRGFPSTADRGCCRCCFQRYWLGLILCCSDPPDIFGQLPGVAFFVPAYQPTGFPGVETTTISCIQRVGAPWCASIPTDFVPLAFGFSCGGNHATRWFTCQTQSPSWVSKGWTLPLRYCQSWQLGTICAFTFDRLLIVHLWLLSAAQAEQP